MPRLNKNSKKYRDRIIKAKLHFKTAKKANYPKFLAIPKEILDSPYRFSPSEMMVLSMINSYDNEKGCTASLDHYAEYCNVSKVTISRSFEFFNHLNLFSYFHYDGRRYTIMLEEKYLIGRTEETKSKKRIDKKSNLKKLKVEHIKEDNKEELKINTKDSTTIYKSESTTEKSEENDVISLCQSIYVNTLSDKESYEALTTKNKKLLNKILDKFIPAAEKRIGIKPFKNGKEKVEQYFDVYLQTLPTKWLTPDLGSIDKFWNEVWANFLKEIKVSEERYECRVDKGRSRF